MSKKKKKKKDKDHYDRILTKRNLAMLAFMGWLIPSPLSK